MEIDLHIISDRNNTINRNIGEATKIIGTLREGSFSLITPQFILKNPSDSRIFKYNYLYAPDFNRYYFIIDYNILNNGLILVQCKVDVLKTYADLIYNSSGLVQSSLKYNGFVDSEYQVETRFRPDRTHLNWVTGWGGYVKPIKEGKYILLANRGD